MNIYLKSAAIGFIMTGWCWTIIALYGWFVTTFTNPVFALVTSLWIGASTIVFVAIKTTNPNNL